jgi:hypothetical protein
VECKTPRSFAADGQRAAGTWEGQVYDFPTRGWKPHFLAGYFDGKASLAFLPPDRPGWGRVLTRSGADGLIPGLNMISYVAVGHFYRPMGGGALTSFETHKPTLTNRSVKIRGKDCVELVIKDFPPGSTRTIWCDPQRDFLPVREEHRNSFSDYDQDYEYRKDDKRGWVLSRWERTSKRRGGTVAYILKAEVKKLEFDVKFTDEAFAPKPPPSSHVALYKNGQVVEQYLIRPDGSKRPLKADERNKNFDEVAKTNADGTPYAPPKK